MAVSRMAQQAVRQAGRYPVDATAVPTAALQPARRGGRRVSLVLQLLLRVGARPQRQPPITGQVDRLMGGVCMGVGGGAVRSQRESLSQ